MSISLYIYTLNENTEERLEQHGKETNLFLNSYCSYNLIEFDIHLLV